MGIVLTNIYIFLLATTLAILEIQIEGAHGWARNLPTWRPAGKWYTKLYGMIMSGREFTGYHLSMFTFVFLMFHLPYFFGLPFTLDHWSKTLSFYFIFNGLWDFLWFVLNPHYPLSRFKKEHITWHPKWFLFAPVDYLFLLILSLLVLLPVHFIHPEYELISWWLFNISLFTIQTVIVIAFTLYILKIDKWQIR